MFSKNLERMIQLAEETFSVRTDPNQLDVTEAVIEKLREIHPATLSEHTVDDGPVVWILLIPSSTETMHRFLNEEISERELLNEVIPGQVYDSIYLCSALVLPEFRKKGLAMQLTLEAIEKIQLQHPIGALYVWPFSREGFALAARIANEVKVPLFARSSEMDFKEEF